MTPFFSIIIPVYNVAPYLRECLDSVLAQTFGDWEAICVDDGSTDGSGVILDEYAAKDGRYRVFHQKNQGVSSARNKALSIVSGKWVLFLDADDIICHSCLSIVYETVCGDAHVEMLKFEYAIMNESCVCSFNNEKWPQSATIDVSSEIPLGLLNVFTWQLAFRSDIVSHVRFPPYIGGEDRVFTCECYTQISSITLIGSKLYGYRQRQSSVMHQPLKFRKVYDDLCSLIEVCKLCENSDKSMPFIKIDWARMFLTGGCLSKACAFNKEERNEIWGKWRMAVKDIRCVKLLSMYERLSIFIVRMMPSFLLAHLCFRALRRFRALHSSVQQ